MGSHVVSKAQLCRTGATAGAGSPPPLPTKSLSCSSPSFWSLHVWKKGRRLLCAMERRASLHMGLGAPAQDAKNILCLFAVQLLLGVPFQEGP